MLFVAVEGKTDLLVVEALLTKAKIGNMQITVLNGRLAPSSPSSRALQHLKAFRPQGDVLVLYDQDSGSVADAVEVNASEANIKFCPAIPTVDAWLFADSNAFFNVVGDKAAPMLGRLPLPEQLPYPKFFKNAMLRDPETLRALLEQIDLLVAGGRSPSLKHFIQTARQMAGLAPLPFDDPSNRSGQLNGEILRNLISEVYPSDKPLYRAASGMVISAEQMMQEITDGTDLGRQYGSDILRVARDLLALQAEKKLSGTRRDR